MFLAEIPTYTTIQNKMYQIRREYLPTAPTSQTDFNTDLAWFDIEPTKPMDESMNDDDCENSNENIVKGDIIHGDGLRVLMFASEDSLKILARAQTILGDGTFRICPSLW